MQSGRFIPDRVKRYLVIIEGDVEPSVYGPYSIGKRLEAAKNHRANDPDKEDGLFKLDVHIDQINTKLPKMSPFMASELED